MTMLGRLGNAERPKPLRRPGVVLAMDCGARRIVTRPAVLVGHAVFGISSSNVRGDRRSSARVVTFPRRELKRMARVLLGTATFRITVTVATMVGPTVGGRAARRRGITDRGAITLARVIVFDDNIRTAHPADGVDPANVVAKGALAALHVACGDQRIMKGRHKTLAAVPE
jgi:hypothetical protein